MKEESGSKRPTQRAEIKQSSPIENHATLSSTARSSVSSHAKEAEGTLSRIKQMMDSSSHLRTQEESVISVSSGNVSHRVARDSVLAMADRDHLGLQLNYSRSEEIPEEMKSREYYLFMSDCARNEQLSAKLEEAQHKAEKLEFTEKERDQLISEKYYLLNELRKYSNHDYTSELKRSKMSGSAVQSDFASFQTPLATPATFQTIQYQEASAGRLKSQGQFGGSANSGNPSELQREYATLKKQLETAEHGLADAKFKHAKLLSQCEERNDQYTTAMRRIKELERDLQEKNSVVKHLRTELDRMHAKYGGEIKKLQKQLELQHKGKKLSSGNITSALNTSINRKSTMSMMAKEPLYNQSRAAMTPSAKGVLISQRKAGHGTMFYGTQQDEGGDDFLSTVDQNTDIISSFNAGLSRIQAGRAVIKGKKGDQEFFTEETPKSARTMSSARGESKTKSAKKGGLLGLLFKN